MARIKRYSEAEIYYRKALATFETIWGVDSPSLSPIVNEFVDVLRADHKYPDAEQWQVRATRIQVKLALRNDPARLN